MRAPVAPVSPVALFRANYRPFLLVATDVLVLVPMWEGPKGYRLQSKSNQLVKNGQSSIIYVSAAKIVVRQNLASEDMAMVRLLARLTAPILANAGSTADYERMEWSLAPNCC